jgi:alpha-D-ribose 1-methylphosphonate 5-phosphate C-P lyase
METLWAWAMAPNVSPSCTTYRSGAGGVREATGGALGRGATCAVAGDARVEGGVAVETDVGGAGVCVRSHKNKTVSMTPTETTRLTRIKMAQVRARIPQTTSHDGQLQVFYHNRFTWQSTYVVLHLD